MDSRRTGIADLKLHPGFAPLWLLSRMEKLAEKIFIIIGDEFGEEEVLSRLSDPLFFQACSNALGYDWDSSGATTVTCAVLKKAFNSANIGIRGAGGKGRRARRALEEIREIGTEFDLAEDEISRLTYASRMTAKVDSAAIQAGYQIYHHMMFISKEGHWTVVQQGMRTEERLARRYHWLSSKVKSFVNQPHNEIVGDRVHDSVLDMTAIESEGCRKLCTELVAEKPERLKRLLLSIRDPDQEYLTMWMELDASFEPTSYYWAVPHRMDWNALSTLYDNRPSKYEQLLSTKGIGPATVRGLALISEIVFGTHASWRDPVRFSFAYGGKDGVPFPVDRKAMDESIQVLSAAVQNARIGDSERLKALRRLSQFSASALSSSESLAAL